jgi:hypothetical protein
VHPVCNPFGVISCNEDGTVFVQKKKKKKQRYFELWHDGIPHSVIPKLNYWQKYNKTLIPRIDKCQSKITLKEHLCFKRKTIAKDLLEAIISDSNLTHTILYIFLHL